METKETLKPWFSNGKKPDEQQFWAWLESYWHKEEKIPIEVIEDINNILVNKADKEKVDKLTQELSNKVDNEIVKALQTYVYGLIDDTLYTASDKTYSINKIIEITEEFLKRAVTDIDYDAETSTLIIEYEEGVTREIILSKYKFLIEVKYNPETKEITFIMSDGSILTERILTYKASGNGGLEVINTNQFQIKEKGVVSTMLSEELLKKIQEKLSKTGETLQEITSRGNETDKDIIINEAVIGRDATNENLKFGKGSLKSVTTAKYNTAIGDNALAANQTSCSNTAVGHYTLSKMQNGDHNTAVGGNAGCNIISSLNSTFIGHNAARTSISARDETIIGANAFINYNPDELNYGTEEKPIQPGCNTSIGAYAGYDIKTGFGNTYIGTRSGLFIEPKGAYNTFIGNDIESDTKQTYRNNCVIIGANVVCKENMDNRLIINSHEIEIHNHEELIDGDFKKRWFKLNGKYVLNYKYTPNADAAPVEGQQAFTPTKMLVADAEGNVGIQNNQTPETPIISDYLYTKNYFSTFFSHQFSETSEIDYIKIQEIISGNISNLIVKGRIIISGVYQKFKLIGCLNNNGFDSCYLKTSKNEDLINSIGLIYYDERSLMLWIKGNTTYKTENANIIIDRIQAYESSNQLKWKDDALVEFKANTLNESLITASITAQLI
ncbi:hypothetical protein [Apibacter adventoris]|uniref:hypothetical protein n=1 Tax=Apibacter adventoris TaxID=1679466 RepID=UPI000CF7245A|nr:hypothetical protein [Apibacter adventoris]PQL95216.1 hypothetical protein C4S76_03245 [Apibacter adventoris]